MVGITVENTEYKVRWNVTSLRGAASRKDR